MATDKQFKVFGVSKFNGEVKVRFANDMLRTKVLLKHGHEDVELVELSEALSKYDGIKLIKDLPEFANAAAQSAIAEYLEDKAPKAPKAKATAPAEAKATEDENVPF
jgi:hypothetical protein